MSNTLPGDNPQARDIRPLRLLSFNTISSIIQYAIEKDFEMNCNIKETTIWLEHHVIIKIDNLKLFKMLYRLFKLKMAGGKYAEKGDIHFELTDTDNIINEGTYRHKFFISDPVSQFKIYKIAMDYIDKVAERRKNI